MGFLLAMVIFLISLVSAARPYQYHGSVIEPAAPAPEITLIDQEKTLFSLDNQEGKVVLLFFGYTSCPDVCPATMVQFKQVRKTLGSDAENVRFVLVTVDPDVDTPEQMKAYLGAIDPALIGLTGSRPDLEAVWKDYGVFVEKSGAMVNHTSRIYLVDPEGNLSLTYAFDTPNEDLVADVRQVLKEAGL
jgi:protein SCO1/2